MKAIIVARVSDEKQDSNEAQISRILDYVKAKQLVVWKTYEIKESSTKGDRKHFQEVIKDVKASKEPVAIVVDTIDRLQRSFRESVMLDDIRKTGKLTIHFYRENLVIHRDSNSADLIRWDMGVMFARAYVLQLSDNVKRVFEQKRRSGEWTGHPRLGYINTQTKNEDGVVVSKSIVPDPERAHLVSMLFELYATGEHSITTLWKRMTEEGLRSMDGKPLSRSNVELILKDKFYYGIACSKKYGEYPHRYPSLIPRELFERCTAVREGRGKRPAKETGAPYIFKGLLRCANCACLLTPETKKGKFIYYSCTNAKGICKRVYVPEKVLLKPLWDLFKEFADAPEAVHKRLVSELRNSHESEAVYHEREISRIRAEYDRVQRRVAGLLDMRLDGGISQDEYDKKLQEFKNQQYRLNIELEEHTKGDHQFHIYAGTVLRLSKNMGRIFESSEPQEKRSILNFILQNPTVEGKILRYSLKKPFDAVLELARNPIGLRG